MRMIILGKFRIFVAATFCVASQAPALSQGQATMSPELTSGVSRWGECQAKQKSKLSNAPLSSRDMSESIMVACNDYEQSFRSLLSKQFGENRASAMVKQLREQFRSMIQNDIDQLSGTPALQDFAGDWGKCYGLKMQELATVSDTAVSLRDKAMAACKDYEEAVRANTTKNFGSAAADNEANLTRQVMLDMADRYLKGELPTP